MFARAVHVGCPRVFMRVDGFVFSEDALMRGITRALHSAGVSDEEACVVYALHHPAGECPDLGFR